MARTVTIASIAAQPNALTNGSGDSAWEILQALVTDALGGPAPLPGRGFQGWSS